MASPHSPGPPRLARLLLRALLPKMLGESIEGDLLERFHRLDSSRGRVWWYWKQVLSLRYLALRRVAAASPGGPGDRTQGKGDGMWSKGTDALKHASRSLRARPALSAIVVLTLALSIGATTAIFTVVNGVLLRPLPFPAPEQLVQVYQTNNEWFESANPQLRAFAERFPLSYPIYEGWRDRQTVFEGIGGYTGGQFTYVGGEDPRILPGAWITADVLSVLGVQPIVGRLPDRSFDRMGAEPAVILSHEFWVRELEADPSVLDRSITLDGIPRPVLAVMPPSFRFSSGLSGSADVWVTFDDELKSRPGDSQFMRSVARIREGVGLDVAIRELEGLQGQINATAAEPPEVGSRGVNIRWRLDETVGDVRSTLLVLLGSVGVVLAIACANIANLLFVSELGRARERAVRAALGAGLSRLVRSQLFEVGILVLLGGALGVILASALRQPLIAFLPPDVPRRSDIVLDGRVLGFSVLLTAVTALVVGLLPSALAGRTDPAAGLKESSRGAGQSRAASRVRSGLVVAEVALAFVLLLGAGLLGNSLWRLHQVEIGFQPEGLVTFQVAVPEIESMDGEEMDMAVERSALFVTELDRKLREVPGVQSVALTSEVPMGGSTSSGDAYVERPNGEFEEVSLNMSTVSNGYFEVLGTPLLGGREFDETDVLGSPPTVVINDAAARLLWPGESPIGRQVRRGDGENERFLTVVGVVSDVRHRSVSQAAVPKMYTPAGVHPPTFQDWVLKVSGDPASVLSSVREAVRSIDPSLPIRSTELMTDVVRSSLSQPRFRAVLVGSLGLLAGVLAILGVGGVVAYMVSHRLPEIGLRIALGASPGGIVAGVTRSGLTLAALGAAIGLAAAVPMSRVMEEFLFGIEAADPVTYGAILLMLLGIGGLASWWPARRAAKVDPLSVLNAE